MTSLHVFRKVAITEAASYLILLFVAMPLKYFFAMPNAVKYVGWAHGVLFILYVLFLLLAAREQKWSFGKIVLLFIASLLPFVPFWLDKKLKTEEYSEN
jgi:integral membrane protein